MRAAEWLSRRRALKRAIDESPLPVGDGMMGRESARAHVVTFAINACYDDRR
jgi:hypothetical protein